MPGVLPEPSRIDRPYWNAAREGVLKLQRCEGCGHLLFPPAARCPKCASSELRWVPLSGRGTIWSWVVFHRRYFPDQPPPYTVVRVKLEEGPAIITNLVDIGDREITMNAPVKVVFQPAGGLVLPQFTLL